MNTRDECFISFGNTWSWFKLLKLTGPFKMKRRRKINLCPRLSLANNKRFENNTTAYREDICLQTLLLLFKYASHKNKRSFVSTANEALVGTLMTIGDVNNIFPICSKKKMAATRGLNDSTSPSEGAKTFHLNREKIRLYHNLSLVVSIVFDYYHGNVNRHSRNQ